MSDSSSSSNSIGGILSSKTAAFVLLASTAAVALGGGYYLLNKKEENSSSNKKAIDVDSQMNNNSNSAASGETIEETIQRVVQLLYSSSNATVSAGLDIVLRLTSISDRISMFERSGGMSALAVILRDRLDSIRDETIENKAYWAVANLCMNPQAGEKFLASDGCRVLHLGIQRFITLPAAERQGTTRKQILLCITQCLLNLSAQASTGAQLVSDRVDEALSLILIDRDNKVFDAAVTTQALKVVTNLSVFDEGKDLVCDRLLTELKGLLEKRSDNNNNNTSKADYDVRIAQILSNVGAGKNSNRINAIRSSGCVDHLKVIASETRDEQTKMLAEMAIFCTS